MIKELPSLLIIDDSQSIRERLVALVQEASVDAVIETAGSYEEALKKISHSQPAVIFLDLNLPDRNGFDMLKMLKEKKLAAEVVIITNNAGAHYKRNAMKLGARAFIDKSNEFESITVVLKDILSGN